MKKSILSIAAVFIFAAGFMLGCGSKDNTAAIINNAEANASLPAAINHPNMVKAAGTIEVAFSPHGSATAEIVKAIGEAKSDIKVQAYEFTSMPIAKALLDAQSRGIKVNVILDKSQETQKYSAVKLLSDNKVPLKIDHDFKIAHSKVMIIDSKTVITGSFNFTKAAEENNAENLLIMRDNSDLAQIYLKNWQWRWDNTQEYAGNAGK